MKVRWWAREPSHQARNYHDLSRICRYEEPRYRQIYRHSSAQPAPTQCTSAIPDAALLRPGIRLMRLAFANPRNVNFMVFSDPMPVSSLAIRLVISARWSKELWARAGHESS